MIAFASLFLGLVLGTEPIELVVGAEVSSVELFLDGRSIGVLSGAPWVYSFDFGTNLEPHLLEAVALDAGGREVGKARQFLNLPQPRAAISVVLERGPPRVARISWESAAGAEPDSFRISLDGRQLEFDDPRRVVLPSVDEKVLHLLQVEMEFEGRTAPRVDLTFGGQYIDEVSTEITALPLTATSSRNRSPTVDSTQGWFLHNGKPLRVIAVEKDLAEIVVVLGRSFPRLLEPRSKRKRPKSLVLDADHRLRFVTPYPEASEGVSTTFQLFPVSQPYRAVGDLYSMLSNLRQPGRDGSPLIGSAIAVAGLKAYESRQRRAVILIPSSQEHQKDPLLQDIGEQSVRAYLDALRVPFFVWEPESRSTAATSRWGPSRPVGSLEKLAAAFAEVSELLDRQWIVWLDGRHLPQEISLAPEAQGFEIQLGFGGES